MDNSNKINYLRFIKFREEGKDYFEIAKMYKYQSIEPLTIMLQKIYESLDEIEKYQLYLCNNAFDRYDEMIDILIKLWNIDRKELYWL